MEPLHNYWRMADTLRRFGGQIERQLQPFCARHSVTPLQLNILMVLYFEGPQTVTGLAKRACMAGANNSALCKKLEGEGRVTRARHAQDERQVVVSLSGGGRQLVEQLHAECGPSLQVLQQPQAQQILQQTLSGLEGILDLLTKNEEGNSI